MKQSSVRPSVCLSVCPIVRPQTRRAARLLFSRQEILVETRERRRLGAHLQRRRNTGVQHGAQQQMPAVSR